jgi:hypothetical protein
MNQHAFSSLQSLLNEAENFIRNYITWIQNNLVVSVDPEIGQVDDADWLPMVGHLPSATIYNTGNLVGNDKLKVLRCQLIPDEKAILHFNSSQDFIPQPWP